ncbi:MAG: hypothetical protein JJU19_11335 [Pararhodobacter sp.]|nr:hypothetical protein [Pararhodobacter sp.]
MLAAFVGVVCFAPLTGNPLRADTPPQVQAVTLSTAGLAMIEASAEVGPHPVNLSIPRRDIDDFLKSLWLVDPNRATARLVLQGPAQLDDLFASLPVTPEDVIDRTRLLAALPGVPVTVARAAGEWQGINMGVSQGQCEGTPCSVLNLMDDAGSLRQFTLSDQLDIRFTASADTDMLRSALAALRAADDTQVSASLHTDDASARSIDLIWLQEAPVWRTAWRALAGPEGVRLTGWAIVENATGTDWQDVRLTLATGSVRAIRAPLYDRLHAQRMLSAPAVEPAYAGIAQFQSRQGDAMLDMAEAAAPAAIDADDGDSFSRFTLTEPVSLPTGQMLMLPFLDETLPQARLTLFRGGAGNSHPQIALEIENPLPLRLPAGVLTLYEDGRGHAGDAIIPELAPGARQIVPFANDTAMTLREDVTTGEQIREMRLVAGVLQVNEDVERRTTYRIEGAPRADRVLTLTHPRRDGWTVIAPQGGTEELDGWRWQIDVGAGARISHVVVERQPRMRRIAVMDIDLPTLAAWQGHAADPELQARLAEIGSLRGQVAAAQRAISRLQEEVAALTGEQDRLVNLIVQLGEASAATPERRTRVDGIDAEITRTQADIRAQQAQADAARARIEALLGD